MKQEIADPQSITMPVSDTWIPEADQPPVETAKKPPSTGEIARMWWPLTLSWLMMVVEGPLVVAMAARLADPEINLAALGGIVRAMTFAIESPLLMILTASATLSKDWDSYRRLRRYTTGGIVIMTLIHIIVTLTPVYYWVAGELIGAPEEIIEPARLGMVITIPYLALVAYRRLNHGVLIRFGYSRDVAVGTAIRLALVLAIIAIGIAMQSVSGLVVGAWTMTGGVAIEAAFIEWRSRRVLKNELRKSPLPVHMLSLSVFLRFYIPLAMVTVAMFFMQPVVSAALSRMPDPVLSLALWAPVIGILSVLSAGGTPLVEVGVTVLDRPGAYVVLRRFAVIVGGICLGLTLLLAATPIGTLWFGVISGLSEPLLSTARGALWLALLYPFCYIFQSFFQGVLTHAHRTERITEAVTLYIVTVIVTLWGGVLWGQAQGIYIGVAAVALGILLQALWMWWRNRALMRHLQIQRETISHV